MICIKCGREAPDGAYCALCGASQAPPSVRRSRVRPNGSGTAYRRGKTWTAQVTIGFKALDDERRMVPIRRTKGGFRTKKEALEYCATLLNDAGRSERRKEVRLCDLWEIYERTGLARLGESKRCAYRIAYEKLGDLRYANIVSLDIGQLQGTIEGRSYYTAKDIKTVLSHLYKIAGAQQYVQSNLADYMELPKLEESEPVPFSAEEVKAFWEAFHGGDTWVGYILLMIYTGMMPGELLKCEKRMIDLENRQIVGCGLKTSTRKSNAIVLADFLEPVVAALMELHGGRKLYGANKDSFYATYYAKLAACGCRKLPPYSCRHTTGTAAAVDAQLALPVVQRIMRHARITTTQRYIHPDRSDALAGVNALNPHISIVQDEDDPGSEDVGSDVGNAKEAL